MTYKDLTIKQYNDILDIIDDYKDIDTGIGTQMEILSYLFGKPVEYYESLSLDDYVAEAEKIAFLLEKPTGTAKIGKNLTINGRKYDVLLDARQMTASQFLDYQTLSTGEDAIKNITRILATFIVPKGKEYLKDYSLGEVLSDLESLDVDYAMSLAFFLHHRFRLFINRFQHYLIWMLRMKMLKTRNKQEKEMLKEQIRLLKSGLA